MRCLQSALWNLLILFMHKKEKEMMALLYAQQIMLGKKTYSQVPRLLKDAVAEILRDSGCEELITEQERMKD